MGCRDLEMTGGYYDRHSARVGQGLTRLVYPGRLDESPSIIDTTKMDMEQLIMAKHPI